MNIVIKRRDLDRKTELYLENGKLLLPKNFKFKNPDQLNGRYTEKLENLMFMIDI